jgi:hypothetical protein
MSALTSLSFRIKAVNGEIGASTQANYSGFVGKSFYYEIHENGGNQGPNTLGNSGPDRVIGVIAYDYFQSRWALLFTQETGLSPTTNTTWVNNVQGINDFLAQIQTSLWPQPVTTDELGQALPYQASLPPIKS